MSGPMMGDLRVALRTVRSRLLRESGPHSRGLHLYRAMMRGQIYILGHLGSMELEYPPSFPELFKAAAGGGIFKGGGAGGFLSVVDVPVIIGDKLPQSKSYVSVEVPQIQFIVTVLDIPVATQRRLPTVQTVLKTGEFPEVQFLDKVEDARCCSTTGARS